MDAATTLRMPSRCPSCQGKLVAGVLLAPRGLFWDWKPRFTAMLSEPVLSQWASLNPHLAALRCLACGLILFGGPTPATGLGREGRAPGFRYACPGCAGDVYSSETTCPQCGHPLSLPQEKIG